MNTAKLRKRSRRVKAPLSSQFIPYFWDEVDGRYALKKEIRDRLQRLTQDAGVDSCQKELLAQEAIFLALQLETMRVNAVTDEAEFDAGSYTQMVNALSGILTKLGLDRKTAG